MEKTFIFFLTQFYRMVYYIIDKCYNNYTFGALFACFALKILLKTFAHVQFCSKFKFQHFYPLLFECHTYAINPVIADLRCVLVKTSLSRLSQILWRKVVYSVVRRIVRYSLWINQHIDTPTQLKYYITNFRKHTGKIAAQ